MAASCMMAMPPSRYQDGRSIQRSNSSNAAASPFRDDQLFALRYDMTTQAEPPIPLPPPRSSLRTGSLDMQRREPARSSSFSSARRSSYLFYPPPRPTPPAEPHPALRTISSPPLPPRPQPQSQQSVPTLHHSRSRSDGMYSFFEDSDDEEEGGSRPTEEPKQRAVLKKKFKMNKSNLRLMSRRFTSSVTSLNPVSEDRVSESSTRSAPGLTSSDSDSVRPTATPTPPRTPTDYESPVAAATPSTSMSRRLSRSLSLRSTSGSINSSTATSVPPSPTSNRRNSNRYSMSRLRKPPQTITIEPAAAAAGPPPQMHVLQPVAELTSPRGSACLPAAPVEKGDDRDDHDVDSSSDADSLLMTFSPIEKAPEKPPVLETAIPSHSLDLFGAHSPAMMINFLTTTR